MLFQVRKLDVGSQEEQGKPSEWIGDGAMIEYRFVLIGKSQEESCPKMLHFCIDK